MRFRPTITIGLFFVGIRAHADAPTTIDMTEHIFGASNTNAVAGHGALTAGISNDGDLAVLSWPGPSFADQLAYLTSNALDVRSQRHLGAPDGMGSYIGLRVTTSSGTSLVWLRDATMFTHAQTYTQPDAPVPMTTFTSDALGLTVVLTDVVDPTVDVLTRRVVITRAASSPVTDASLVLYENLSPTLSKIPMLPFADWLFDAKNDFAAVYDRDAHAVIHVHPSDRALITSLFDFTADPTLVDYGDVDALMKTTPSDADVDAFVAGIDSAFPPGVAAIVTMEPTPMEFQVGSDATPICASVGVIADGIEALTTEFPGFVLPIDPSTADAARCTDSLPAVRAARGWTWAPNDALADLSNASLSGSRVAACQTNAALVAPLTFTDDVAEGSALFAFGASVAAARAALQTSTAVSAEERQTASEQAAHAVLGSAALPDASLGDRVVSVALRSLVNLYVARDRGTGAVVASISRQPPYYLDWPRDGSFITQAIDVSGILPWGTQRGEWYVGLQRRDTAPSDPLLGVIAPADPETGDVGFPAFAWEMNYYADATIGGNIRWEIDNTALHIWALASHAAALEGDDRAAFISQVWPTTHDALSLLERWRDPTTNLPALANEDDHLDLTSTLHGATAVYAALISGSRLALAAGDHDAAESALGCAMDLHDAIITAYYSPSANLFQDTQTRVEYIPGTTGVGDTAWLVWPARLLDEDDPRLEAQLTYDMNVVMKDILGQTDGGAYDMKNVVSAALLGKDGGSRDLARQAVAALANIATPDTLEFGEVFVTSQGASGPTFSNRVAAPHVWEGVLFYLSAMALTSPERFDPQITAFPLPSDSVVGGCSTANDEHVCRDTLVAWLLMLIAFRCSKRLRVLFG